MTHHHQLPDMHSVTKNSVCACGFVVTAESKRILLSPEFQEMQMQFWDPEPEDCECDECLLKDDNE